MCKHCTNRVQLKPVYSNHFLAAKNGKKKPMKINIKCEFFTHQEKIISRRKRLVRKARCDCTNFFCQVDIFVASSVQTINRQKNIYFDSI